MVLDAFQLGRRAELFGPGLRRVPQPVSLSAVALKYRFHSDQLVDARDPGCLNVANASWLAPLPRQSYQPRISFAVVAAVLVDVEDGLPLPIV